jgi:hypothetical protein
MVERRELGQGRRALRRREGRQADDLSFSCLTLKRGGRFAQQNETVPPFHAAQKAREEIPGLSKRSAVMPAKASIQYASAEL